MTNQNVVVSDANSAINVSILVPNSPLYLSSVGQKPPTIPGNHLSISKNKKLLKQLEVGTTPKINAWVDSMRASSATHTNSSASLPRTEDHGSWILNHPSALNMFEQIASASKGKQIVMFLDYDRTLSPIVDDPDRAFKSEAMRAAVRNVTKAPATTSAAALLQCSTYLIQRVRRWVLGISVVLG